MGALRSNTVLARVMLLLAVVACALLGFRFAPDIQIGVIGHPTATLVNDTEQLVVVLRCVTTCARADEPVDLAANRTLRLQPGSAAEWLVQDTAGTRLGCITVPTASGQAPGSIYVSRAAPCRT